MPASYFDVKKTNLRKSLPGIRQIEIFTTRSEGFTRYFARSRAESNIVQESARVHGPMDKDGKGVIDKKKTAEVRSSYKRFHSSHREICRPRFEILMRPPKFRQSLQEPIEGTVLKKHTYYCSSSILPCSLQQKSMITNSRTLRAASILPILYGSSPSLKISSALSVVAFELDSPRREIRLDYTPQLQRNNNK